MRENLYKREVNDTVKSSGSRRGIVGEQVIVRSVW